MHTLRDEGSIMAFGRADLVARAVDKDRMADGHEEA